MYETSSECSNIYHRIFCPICADNRATIKRPLLSPLVHLYIPLSLVYAPLLFSLLYKLEQRAYWTHYGDVKLLVNIITEDDGELLPPLCQ